MTFPEAMTLALCFFFSSFGNHRFIYILRHSPLFLRSSFSYTTLSSIHQMSSSVVLTVMWIIEQVKYNRTLVRGGSTSSKSLRILFFKEFFFLICGSFRTGKLIRDHWFFHPRYFLRLLLSMYFALDLLLIEVAICFFYKIHYKNCFSRHLIV